VQEEKEEVGVRRRKVERKGSLRNSIDCSSCGYILVRMTVVVKRRRGDE
jgi:hypothetical protein